MKILVSTTWFGTGQTKLAEVMKEMDELDIDGIELGSTHAWQPDFADVVKTRKRGKLFIHNYFPPAKNNLVLNIASNNSTVREASLCHAKNAISFAADSGAALYTIHPGFLSDAEIPAPSPDTTTPYDFSFASEWADLSIAQDHLRNSLDTLLDEAANHGVRLAVETQGSFADSGVSLLERFEDFEVLTDQFSRGLAINFNLAHSWFAARVHDYAFKDLIEFCRPFLAAVELSHNDGTNDYHQALVEDSYVLDWVNHFGDTPMILEFRNASLSDLKRSIALVRQVAGSTSTGDRI